MSGFSEEAIQQHVRVYLRVFAALAALTVVTVTVGYLHLPILPAICVALLIAVFKGSLVAGFFMHLVSEKKVIFWILGFTAFCFFNLMLLLVYAK